MGLAVDSFQTIKAFLERNPSPTKEDVREISAALRDVYDRLIHVRAVCPTVDYGDRLWRLLEFAGFESRRLGKAND